jgi:hypothetical protein
MLAELTAVGLLLAGAPGERAVPCAEVIAETSFPHLGNRDPRYRNRLVLDVISVPPALVPGSARTGETRWTHFSKWGLVVRGGATSKVSVSVPAAWRSRVAIAWGSGGHGVFHTVRLSRCGGDPARGHAYAGGFFLRKSSGCVPLRFTSGSRTRLVRFGIVQRCR